jgi:hypothetical protein
MTAALGKDPLSRLSSDIKLLKWLAGLQIALSAATLGILLRSLS